MNRATEEEIEGFQGWSLKLTLSYILFWDDSFEAHSTLNSTTLLIFHKLKMHIFIDIILLLTVKLQINLLVRTTNSINTSEACKSQIIRIPLHHIALFDVIEFLWSFSTRFSIKIEKMNWVAITLRLSTACLSINWFFLVQLCTLFTIFLSHTFFKWEEI